MYQINLGQKATIWGTQWWNSEGDADFQRDRRVALLAYYTPVSDFKQSYSEKRLERGAQEGKLWLKDPTRAGEGTQSGLSTSSLEREARPCPPHRLGTDRRVGLSRPLPALLSEPRFHPSTSGKHCPPRLSLAKAGALRPLGGHISSYQEPSSHIYVRKDVGYNMHCIAKLIENSKHQISHVSATLKPLY